MQPCSLCASLRVAWRGVCASLLRCANLPPFLSVYKRRIGADIAPLSCAPDTLCFACVLNCSCVAQGMGEGTPEAIQEQLAVGVGTLVSAKLTSHRGSVCLLHA